MADNTSSLCGVANPGGVPCTKEKGHAAKGIDAQHDLASYGPSSSPDPKLLPERIWIVPGNAEWQPFKGYDGDGISYHRDDLCTPPVAPADAVEAEHIVRSVFRYGAFEDMRESANLVSAIAAALTAATQRGYEQAREDAVDECAKLESVYLEKERSQVALGDGSTASYFDGKATAAAELGESIAALTPAPEKWATCAKCGQKRSMSTLAGIENFLCRYCFSTEAAPDVEQSQEAE